MKVAIVLGNQSYGDILILIGFTVKLMLFIEKVRLSLEAKEGISFTLSSVFLLNFTVFKEELLHTRPGSAAS